MLLQWWYVEVSPSDLMADGADRVGFKSQEGSWKKCEAWRKWSFSFDEFEEIAGRRDKASRVDKSITNEFLKQVPLLKRHARRFLLVCATNYIRDLDPALLRPGRFDCIIPVGVLEEEARAQSLNTISAKQTVGMLT